MKTIEEIKDKMSEMSIELKKANDEDDVMSSMILWHKYRALAWVMGEPD